MLSRSVPVTAATAALLVLVAAAPLPFRSFLGGVAVTAADPSAAAPGVPGGVIDIDIDIDDNDDIDDDDDEDDAYHRSSFDVDNDNDRDREFSSLSNDALPNLIDMDQVEISEILRYAKTVEGFDRARAVYEKGGYANPVARVGLSSPLAFPLPAGTKVAGPSVTGFYPVSARILADHPAGAAEIEIEYDIDIDGGDPCLIGGLGIRADWQGCLAANGTLRVAPSDDAGDDGTLLLPYADHDYETMTRNRCTLRSYSADAEARMHRCAEGCPFRTYGKFRDYYGRFDYADRFVDAAFRGLSTRFYRGNAKFNRYGLASRAKAITKATVLLSVWMYVLRELEAALGRCRPGCSSSSSSSSSCDNDSAVWHWNDAVALYTGSRTGPVRIGDDPDAPYLGSFADLKTLFDYPLFPNSVLLYRVSNDECRHFGTCDANDDNDNDNDNSGRDGNSNSNNRRQFVDFNAGATMLKLGKCDEARIYKEEIERRMVVPLVQGTLRSAYDRQTESDRGAGGEDASAALEVAEAEGAVYAASILPLVHACDEDAARVVHEATRIGTARIGTARDIGEALESVYGCLGIRSEEIGRMRCDPRDDNDNDNGGGGGWCPGRSTTDPASRPNAKATTTTTTTNRVIAVVALGCLAAGFGLGVLASWIDRRRSSSSSSDDDDDAATDDDDDHHHRDRCLSRHGSLLSTTESQPSI